MAFARTHAVALRGAVGTMVEVQVDVSSGTPGTTIVGRADQVLHEAQHRIRMAVQHSGIDWPTSKRVTILLSPADLPKGGTHYDLALAVAAMTACEELPPLQPGRTVFLGELSLDGGLRAVPGVLPMVLAAARQGFHQVFVPEPQVAEASLVPGVDVVGMRSLAQVVAELRGDRVPSAPPVPDPGVGGFLGWRGGERLDILDLADLRGLADAKYAVEVAVSGGHHLFLSGPKGCGKTSLAERIPGIMPDLEREVAIELMALRSLAGRLDPHEGLAIRPPYVAPHHDASKAAVVGGGKGTVTPGQISLAHGGVVFLDEFPLFHLDVIDALRDPMENGDITIARGEEVVTLPAQALVVVAANPCPCGNEGVFRGPRCECRPAAKRDYASRLRGPVLDRIDVVRHLQPPAPGEGGAFDRPESSAVVARRVAAARARQRDRLIGTPWRLNGEVPGAVLTERWPLPEAAMGVLETAIVSGQLTNRGSVRVHRLAWTVADLAGRPSPTVEDLHVALALRMGEPLPRSVVGPRLIEVVGDAC